MKWPSFLQRKSNPVSRVILLGLNAQEPIRHEDFTRLSKASFERNPTVYGCVDLIARAGSTVPWVLYETGKTSTSKTRRVMSPQTHRATTVKSLDGRLFPRLRKTLEQTEIETHPLLALLEKPNDTQAQAEFTEQLLSYWLIAGNEYQNFISPTGGKNKGRPLEMWNLRPDRVQVLKSDNAATGLVKGYRYKVNNVPDKPQDFDAASVIHHKFFHPTDDFYGLSPLQAAARAWQTSNLAADWNFALLNQGARPSGAMVIPTMVNDDVYERMKKELADSYSGALNAGAPMFLEGGVKWEPMSLTPMEMDFLAGLQNADVQICRVYHTAPELVGVPGAKQYNSFAEARMSLWQEAILPLLDRLRDSYNHRITPLFGERLYLDYDRDQIDAIQEDQAKVWDKLNRTRFLSTNEKRIAAGYSTYDDPVADTPESILNPTPGATGINGAPDNAPTSLRSAVDRLRKMVEDDPELTPEHKSAALQFLDDRQQKAQRLTPQQQRELVKMKTLLAKHYRGQGKDLAAYLRTALSKLE